MLNIGIKKSDLPIINELKFVTSKKVNIDFGLDGIIQISCNNKNLVDILEKILIELFITKMNKQGDVYDSFSLILEKINKEIKIISKDYNLDNIDIFLGIIKGDTLHFSILGTHSIYLIKNNKIIDIADGMQGKNLEFSYISSGNVNIGDMIFLSNLNLLDYITKDDIFEIIKNENIDKLEIIEQILKQEATEEQYNLISLSNASKNDEETKNIAFDLIKSKFLSIKDKITENEKVDTLITKIKNKINLKNKYVYLSFLGVGILFSALFLYGIISSILTNEIEKSVPELYKNKLIEAKMILERANKDVGNKEVFEANIKKAENLIFEVRNEKLFLNDVTKLLDYISLLKKQSNGIETFILDKERQHLAFDKKDFGLVGIYEVSKKYYFIGKNSLIGPYVKGEEPKMYTYPDGEEVMSADVTQEGNIYLLTKTYRILQFYKQEFKYINVEGQRTWENSIGIKTFNSNLYLLSDKGNQIYRHKPGVNGFSTKGALIDDKDSKNMSIYDFAIDGGFYIINSNLTIDKIFSSPSYSKNSIIINGIKNISYENKTGIKPKLFVGLNLNYIYMVMDNKIWIFEPDTRNYKDVKGVKYVGQLEPSEGKIDSIFVPKDGTIHVGNDSGIYIINFEVSDNKVIVR